MATFEASLGRLVLTPFLPEPPLTLFAASRFDHGPTKV